jgi:proteic killer suppression protein
MHELTQASQETKLLSGAKRRDLSDYWEGRRSSRTSTIATALRWRLTHNDPRYRVISLIRSFKDKETEKIFAREISLKLPQAIQQVALRKLRMLNRALTIQDLRVPPANRLERLSADRAGQYSIRINDQWRICFERRDSDAFNVEITDYH